MVVAPAPQDGVELLDRLRKRPAVTSSDDVSHLLLDPLRRCLGGPNACAAFQLRLGLAVVSHTGLLITAFFFFDPFTGEGAETVDKSGKVRGKIVS